MQNAFIKNGFFIPGHAHGAKRSFWLFPYLAPNKQQYRDFAQEQGVFCYRASTQIFPVPMPEHKKAELGECTQINQMFKQICFLPVHNLIPDDQIELMAKRFVGINKRYEDYLNQTR